MASTVVEKKVHVHDCYATILRMRGRDHRLTDVFGNVVLDLLA